jgi:2,4-dienoyl-CoA reductase (NADPH2)
MIYATHIRTLLCTKTAEWILANGSADLVSMARPFLADPEFVLKAKQGRADEINTCIGCNQVNIAFSI